MLHTNTHHNNKVQNTYNLYGEPTHYILVVCSIPQLNSAEVYWTAEFDALNPLVGLCIIEAGTNGGYGVNSSKAIYSKIQVLRVFSHLYKGILSATEIALATKMEETNVYNILHGASHSWLKDTYTSKYLQMLSRN